MFFSGDVGGPVIIMVDSLRSEPATFNMTIQGESSMHVLFVKGDSKVAVNISLRIFASKSVDVHLGNLDKL